MMPARTQQPVSCAAASSAVLDTPMGRITRQPELLAGVRSIATLVPHLNVHFLPELVAEDQLADTTAVVIDVLRATTTIVAALAAGALNVVPCLTVEEALAAAERLPANQRVLGGERKGLPIAGFDLGNSPAEYTPASVGGKTIFFTTTNGTRAMHCCRAARRVLVGALVNLSAVCRQLVGAERIELVCAGVKGQVTRDDVLAAGAIVERFAAMLDIEPSLSDTALLARDAFRGVGGLHVSKVRLAEALGDSRGGRNLIEIGMADDIPRAAEIDRYDVVPELDLSAWRIRPATT